MLRPAASPWRGLARRTRAATARRTPIAARCININATSSTSDAGLEPQSSVDASKVLGQSPGTYAPLQLHLTSLHLTRRQIRRHRHALLPPLRLALRFTDALHPPRHISRPQRQVGEHTIHTLLPRTLPTCAGRHSLPLPESLLHEPCHRSHIDQIANIEHSLSQSGWQAGLGH